MAVHYHCENEKRRQLVREHPSLNGIDYVEVLDLDYLELPALAGTPERARQRTLLVHCLKPFSDVFTANNVRIEGGVRVASMGVLWAAPAAAVPDELIDRGLVPEEELIDRGLVTEEERDFFSSQLDRDRLLVVRSTSVGDFSTYRLSLVRSVTDPNPPPGFDPQLSHVEFSPKVECPSEFDCQPAHVCPPDKFPEPAIDYLAKDYDSFRRLILDRLAVIMPDWRERNPADLGMALIEVLAYAADHLSYHQDAVATEAYLGTARKRASLRRHARLLDYPMHDGCNARAWVTLEANTAGDGAVLPGPSEDRPGTLLLTKVDAPRGALHPDRVGALLSAGAEVFETMHEVRLYEAHNELFFYTWGDEECCLPAGATRATLRDDPERRLRLRPGDVLIFEEVRGPRTCRREDADPAHRHVVRLTRVDPEAPLSREEEAEPSILPEMKTDALTGQAIVEIEWHEQDALPFPLCLTTCLDETIKEVSVARGNVVLADHGRTRPRAELDDEPEELERAQAEGRYLPTLRFGPLTHQGRARERERQPVPFDPEAPAAAACHWEMHDVLPTVRLVQEGNENLVWLPRRDLLNSDRFATEFVVETEDDGRVQLRFGDGALGRRPAVGTRLTPVYRVGNGRAGNTGADAIAHVVTSESGITNVRNPLPAQGGTDPEPLEQVRLYAPQAFRTQERAVTEADYAVVAQRHPQVQRAAATLRWTGSWHTVFVTVDRKGGWPVNDAFKADLHNFLQRFRLAGYDLKIDAPRFVSLNVALTVCVEPNYIRSDVKQALLETLGSRDLPDGRRGFFHPDNCTFGQPVYLSRLVAGAMQIPGVLWVEAIRFQRWGEPPRRELADGRMTFSRLEIARLDNDPNAPERGKIEFFMEGGL